MADPLTAAHLRALKPPPTGRLEVADGACPGLCLRVVVGHPWKWTLRLHVAAEGKFRRFTLGEYSDSQGIRWAREAAASLRQQVKHEGRDPHRERRERGKQAEQEADRARLTLGVLVTDWQNQRLSARSEGYAKEAVRALRVAFAKYWDAPAYALTPDDIEGSLAALVTSGGRGHAMARRTHAYCTACFAWAIKRRVITANPFLLVAVDDYRVNSRERVLSDDELVNVWSAATDADSTFGRLVQLLILTGQRREEVAGMTWAELSADRATWTIPAVRAKNRTANIVPLSLLARTLLPIKPGWAEPGDLIFPGQRNTPFSGWSKCKQLLDRTSCVTGWRLHDLRRTLATGLQRLGVRLEVTEAVLNHLSGSRTGIVGIYQRHHWTDEKRVALAAWAEHVAGLVQQHLAPLPSPAVA